MQSNSNKENNAHNIQTLRIYILFYANDHEPIHVHVVKGNQKAKFRIFPVELVENHGLKKSELKMVEVIIEENEEVIAEHWNKFFNQYK